MNHNLMAIIPARSGSKGVPGKNVVRLGGHPLLAYSIAAARMAGIERVWVSTDALAYAEIARRYGAETPFLRPPEISTDRSTDYEFMRHAMEWMADREDDVPELWLHLRPTTPLRDPTVLVAAVARIRDCSEAVSLRSGHAAPESPFKWLLRDDAGFFVGLRTDLTPEKVNLPRQQFPQMYIPDGYVDIVRASHVLQHTTLHGDRMLVFESPRCAEIDTREDLEYIEYQVRQGGSPLLEYLNQFN